MQCQGYFWKIALGMTLSISADFFWYVSSKVLILEAYYHSKRVLYKKKREKGKSKWRPIIVLSDIWKNTKAPGKIIFNLYCILYTMYSAYVQCRFEKIFSICI